MSTKSRNTQDRGRGSGGKHAARTPRPADEDVVITPSQAEGDADMGDEGQGDVVHTPSQAEGDRETIERDLEEKGQ